MIAKVDLKIPAKLTSCDKSLNRHTCVAQLAQIRVRKSFGSHGVVKQPAPHPATGGGKKPLSQFASQSVLVDNVKLYDHIAPRTLNRLENCPESLLSVDQKPARVSLGWRQPSQTDSQSLRVRVLFEKRSPEWRQGSLRLPEPRVKFSMSLNSCKRVTRESGFAEDEEQRD